jgi:mRNA interferase MazF
MRAGDLLEVDFGTPIGSEPGFRRPAIVVTADLTLEGRPRTVHVVPVTSKTSRGLPSEVPLNDDVLDRPSVAQCHLSTTISIQRVVDIDRGHVGAASLAQIRSVLSDLLDLP